MTRTTSARRRGFTLIELVLSMAAASVLMVGLTSAMFIALKATDTSNGPTAATLDGSAALTNLASDIEFAHLISERTPTAITFTVPDRDGDSSPETIRYAWSGTPGDPLTRQVNGGTVATLVDNVHVFQHDLPPASANLLSNADMEAGEVNWEAFTDSDVASENEAYTGVKSLYHLRWASSGESGVRQDVSAQILNGTTYDVGEWLMTYETEGPYIARAQLRVTSTGEGEQIFDGGDCSVNDTTWSSVQGTVTPAWTGTLLSAYWEGVSDMQEVYLDDAYLRVALLTGQNVNIRLQVGNDANALVQSGVGLLNSPL